MGYIANGLGVVLHYILNMVQLLVIASVIVSWVSADPSNPIVQVIHRTTEPIYRPFRKLTRLIPGPLDFAPIAVFLVIIFLQQSLVRFLMSVAPG